MINNGDAPTFGSVIIKANWMLYDHVTAEVTIILAKPTAPTQGIRLKKGALA